MNLQEEIIKFSNEKLLYYISVGRGEGRLVCLLLVSSVLSRTISKAYHTSGVEGYLWINKTLTVLRLRFLWPNMCVQLILCGKAWLVYIQLKFSTRVNQKLVHPWLLIMLFVIISTNIWYPDETVSPTGISYIINWLCNMYQLLCHPPWYDSHLQNYQKFLSKRHYSNLESVLCQ